MKLPDGSVKTVTAAGAGHLSKPGTTTLRMTGGVITAASSTPGSVSSASQQQASFTVFIYIPFILHGRCSYVRVTLNQRAVSVSFMVAS